LTFKEAAHIRTALAGQETQNETMSRDKWAASKNTPPEGKPLLAGWLRLYIWLMERLRNANLRGRNGGKVFKFKSFRDARLYRSLSSGPIVRVWLNIGLV
jgi:hypothetical protein